MFIHVIIPTPTNNKGLSNNRSIFDKMPNKKSTYEVENSIQEL